MSDASLVLAWWRLAPDMHESCDRGRACLPRRLLRRSSVSRPLLVLSMCAAALPTCRTGFRV